MATAHENIKQKFQEVIQKRKERLSELQDTGQKLVASYTEYLSLPAEKWIDSQGNMRSYVSVGFLNDKGLLQQSSLSNIKLSHDLSLKFVISTVIDELPVEGIVTADVNVSITKEAGSFYIDIGANHLSIRIFETDAPYAFNEAILALENSVIAKFTDHRLYM